MLQRFIRDARTCPVFLFKLNRTHLFPIQHGAYRDVAGARVDAKLLFRITAHNGVENEVIWGPVEVKSSYLRHNEQEMITPERY